MKKKKSRKQASDFAKELDELDAENEEESGAAADGDDVFGQDGAKGEDGVDAWVAEGREATYPEVSVVRF